MLAALVFALFFLGLAAVDPLGIAAMPVLLLQPHRYRQSIAFLAGSFAALAATGIILTRGLGMLLLAFESGHHWLQPLLEGTAGIILLTIGCVLLYRQVRNKHHGASPRRLLIDRLNVGWWQLFLAGALLVTMQSLADVVFVVAMVRVGQAHVSLPVDLAAVCSYAVGALMLQAVVVVTYALAPDRYKPRTLAAVRRLLNRYADPVVIATSFVLGAGLLLVALWPLVK